MKTMMLTAAALALFPVLAIAKSPSLGPVVMTSEGKVAGISASGVESFLGIPYGADTGGENRFQAPRPAAPWRGVREATRMGHRCPQITHHAPLDIIRFPRTRSARAASCSTCGHPAPPASAP